MSGSELFKNAFLGESISVFEYLILHNAQGLVQNEEFQDSNSQALNQTWDPAK